MYSLRKKAPTVIKPKTHECVPLRAWQKFTCVAPIVSNIFSRRTLICWMLFMSTQGCTRVTEQRTESHIYTDPETTNHGNYSRLFEGGFVQREVMQLYLRSSPYRSRRGSSWPARHCTAAALWWLSINKTNTIYLKSTFIRLMWSHNYLCIVRHCMNTVPRLPMLPFPFFQTSQNSSLNAILFLMHNGSISA